MKHVSARARCFCLLSTVCGVAAVVIPQSLQAQIEYVEEPAANERARGILDRLGIDRGICVLLGDSPAGLAIALARGSDLTVYAQVVTREAAETARSSVDAAGLLGTRIYIEKGSPSQIHLADNLADAVVVMPAAARLIGESRGELLRVVNPLGKVLLGDETITKSYPAESDDWSHPYHGPDNNPQSTDGLARGPYITQFTSEPWYVPMPSVSVASAGRMFKAYGHLGFNRRSFPWINTLIAINGYNGTLLWKRPLTEGFMIHRNTMVATPDILYLADNTSCKLIETATGETKGEIRAPADASGPSWKWMALVDGVLYALVGQEESPDPTVRWDRNAGGWPWRPMSQGYDREKYPWGFGHTFIAIDLATKEVFWRHTEKDAVDSRAVCMKDGRIYYYSHPNFLACLDAKQGKPVWRTCDAKLLEAVGPHFKAQTWQWGFSSTSYIKCSDRAIYFAGPQRPRLVAAGTEDGRLLWSYPEGNFQLVLHKDVLYAMGSRQHASKKFDPLTGEILADLTGRRAACTRATGTVDSILCRAGRTVPSFHAGTLRLMTCDDHSMRLAPMRPPCQDGVIIAGGMLHWGAWMCDCNLSLVGNLCLGPGGDFDFNARAIESERLELASDTGRKLPPLSIAPGDWPTYRADNRRTAASVVDIPKKVDLNWQLRPPGDTIGAAPVTAGGLVFLAGSDGVVRAIDAATGECRWTSYTGGRIYYPPSVDRGRLFVGSGDGRVYAMEAATGRKLWTFRAAPHERKIALYGRLMSTWPVAGGVLAQGDTVYAAAGIVSWDGTHVYALDAKTGKIRWQNNTSGRLAGDDKVSGVSVQGHLLLDQNRLYLAGGNVVSPAVYDIKDGRCLNKLEDEFVKGPRGSELVRVAGTVGAFGRMLYSPEEYRLGPFRLPYLLQADASEVIVRSTGADVFRVDPATAAVKKPKALWASKHLGHPVAIALGKNAVVVAGQLPTADETSEPTHAVAALDLNDGQVLWSRPVPVMPTPNGLALDSGGRIVVALSDGSVWCFGPGP